MKRLIVLLLASMVMPAWGGIIIYGARVIYPAQKKDITVQLLNDDSRSSLVQAWIDDGDISIPPEKIKVPFMLTPPVVRVAGGAGQQLKIKGLPNHLPTDRESLFYLNVLDIPPNSADGNKDNNRIKFAMQNRIKFIYRPQGISGVDKKAFSRIKLKVTTGGINVKNETANWIVIPAIENSGKVNNKTLLLAPRAEQLVAVKNYASRYTVTLIDDHGNYLSEKIDVIK